MLRNVFRFFVWCFPALSASQISPATKNLPEYDVADDASHGTSLLQRPGLVVEPASTFQTLDEEPHLISLRRESVPVYRRGKVASFKTSYSGILKIGTPPQAFRVVFDTGSGHVVLPAVECQSEACLMKGRRKYNMSMSNSAVAINSDGSVVPEGELCDQVAIGFGTGEIIGEFTQDEVCFQAESYSDEAAGSESKPPSSNLGELCAKMDIVLAVEMSTQPFKTFRFDGILGLGLDSLALNKNFSAFETLARRKLPSAHFGVFLTDGEEGEVSQIAMGGYDKKRLLDPLFWTPVVLPEQGYWLVRINAIRINGDDLDVCRDGTCRGVVDTGTSHLGVPAPYEAEIAKSLTVNAGELYDCRLASAPVVEIEIPGFNISLDPLNYMRQLPLREGVSVSSFKTGHTPKGETTGDAAKIRAIPAQPQPASILEKTLFLKRPPDPPAAVDPNPDRSTSTDANGVRHYCKPRLMPVRMAAPMGPKLFIFGEPVLHKYYTAYDWDHQHVGIGLANNRLNTLGIAALDRKRVDDVPKEVI